jgi:hypothetical protein
MTVKHLIFILALAAMLCAPARAFGQQPQQAKAATMSEADRKRLDDLRARGFEALYNLDYEEGQRNFREIVRLFPEHPAGPQFLAASLWARTLNQSRRLQSNLYNSETFYAQKEEKADPRVVAQFREWTRAAKQLAEARLKVNPKDVEALYFLGATEGLKAAFATAVERSFMGGLRGGSNSVDRHREVIRLDPSFHDAELTIGLYDYVVGSLPLPVKILASIGGFRGSKKRGLMTLERVAREGRWANDDAKALLILLYKREKRFADALALSRELSEKYSRNYLFKLESADALISLAVTEQRAGKPAEAEKARSQALAIFDELQRPSSPSRDTAAKALDLIHFRHGEVLLTAGQPEAAAKQFLAAASAAGAEANLATIAHLRAAQSLDLAGKRNEALSQYRAVLSRPNVDDSHDEAKQGLREPYKIKGQEKSTTE